MSAWSSHKRRKLEDGVPPLERRVTESGASIPKDHKAVTFEEKPFGLLAPEVFDKIKGYELSLHVKNGVLRYASENDVATHVTNLLNDILAAFGLENLIEVYTEVGIFNVRPHVWGLMAQGYPIGVVEVKKPDKKGQHPALNHPNLLGELNNFMLRLKTFYGITPVFGLLTNMISWRVAWFPEENADEVSSETESFNGPDAFQFSRSPESLFRVPPHQIPALKNATLLLGLGDGACANIGSKCSVAGRIACTVGTSAAVHVCLPLKYPDASIHVEKGLFCYRIDRVHVLVGGALTDGGSVFEWIAKLLNLESVTSDTFNKVASSWPAFTSRNRLKASMHWRRVVESRPLLLLVRSMKRA